ncbi:MAG: carboxypeptidase regulatory-like domain-containing protein, partial [Anaerolineae bacterium]
VTAHGELAGRVLRSDGAGIPAAQVVIMPHAAGQVTLTTTADASGAFTVALRGGLYDVEGRAFGFAVGRATGILVEEDRRREVALTLAPLPAGAVFGRVTDAATAAPISATITVDAAPVQAQSDPTTGLYSLALPEGTWTLRFVADAHRIVRRAVTVSAAAGQELNVALPPGPRILLVDSGPWYYGSRIAYFADALEALDYPIHLWSIRDPAIKAGDAGGPPNADLLSKYDLVIWSAPLDSPGLVNAGNALRTYTLSGGRLLLSGQDVAYFDGGGSAFDPPQSYFLDDWGLRWKADGDLMPLTGAADGPLAGITVALNTADSARNQAHPDRVEIRNALRTRPLLMTSGGEIGATRTEICRPYGSPGRAAWLGFGLEGAGPRATRLAVLGRLLDWLQAPAEPYGLHLSPATDLLIAPAGHAVSQTLHITSTGTLTDTLDLGMTGGPWPATLHLPDGRQVAGAGSFSLGSCDFITVALQVTVPPDIGPDVRAVYTLTARSRGDPAIVQTATVTFKTPAPVLFVDDERWYQHDDRYTAALDALGVSYDVFNTGGGNWGPPTDTLKNYTVAVWTTGYDWYRPLTADDESRLTAFLDAGGRLLLTGQDILDVVGLDDFVRERLGVLDATLSVTATEVVAVPGGPLGDDLGPWRLLYPFTNWSDAVTPRRGTQGVAFDEHRYIVGVVNGTGRWRTAFFPFPLEALDDAARTKLIGRALLWLSPLGASRLEAPPFTAGGVRIPITLTLGLATEEAREGLRARLPLPAGLAVAPGSVRGPWSVEANGAALAWAGSLAPGEALRLHAALIPTAPSPAGAAWPLRAHLYAGNGLTVTADADVFVDVPWLVVQEEATPSRPWPGQTVHYTITVQNIGVVATTARLTDTLPSEIRLISGSVWASRGTVTSSATRVRWTDALAPGDRAQVGFRGTPAADRSWLRAADRVEVTDERGRRIVTGAIIASPPRTYLPVLWR